MRNIYHTDILLENTIQRLKKDPDIIDCNRELIFKYQELQIIEELGLKRQYKCMQVLTRISKVIDQPFRQVDQHDIAQFIIWLDSTEYSDQTKADYKKILKTFYKYLYPRRQKMYIKKINPNLKNHTEEPDILTTKELLRLLNLDIKNKINKGFLHILIWSGCRLSEILNLTPEDIIIDSKGAILNVTGKTGPREVRVFHCNEIIFYLIQNTDANTYIFKHSTTYYNKLTKTWAYISDIDKRVYPHLFRHTLFSIYINNGMALPMAKKHFGWSKFSKIPETVYAHSDREVIDSTILNISKLML